MVNKGRIHMIKTKDKIEEFVKILMISSNLIKSDNESVIEIR